jgi:hypothetical protein
MQFTPITPASPTSLLLPGVYAFRVASAIDTTSRAGNNMVQLDLVVWDNERRQYRVRDWLLPQPVWADKVRSFFDAASMQTKYITGKIEAADCLGVHGRLRVDIQESVTPRWPRQNTVKLYLRDPQSLSGGKAAAINPAKRLCNRSGGMVNKE